MHIFDEAKERLSSKFMAAKVQEKYQGLLLKWKEKYKGKTDEKTMLRTFFFEHAKCITKVFERLDCNIQSESTWEFTFPPKKEGSQEKSEKFQRMTEKTRIVIMIS